MFPHGRLSGRRDEANEVPEPLKRRRIMIERITANPNILGGKPIIRGTRISVEFILDLLASNVPEEEILEDYPHLKREDIQACLICH
jgi:uncharacterized protein (DUF433 family)